MEAASQAPATKEFNMWGRSQDLSLPKAYRSAVRRGPGGYAIVGSISTKLFP